MEQNELNNSNKTKLFILTLVILLVSVAGISYAYFTIQITGNDTASSMRLRTANMSLVYNDVQIVSGEYVEPGWTQTKTLTVTNTGNVDVYYSIIWRDLINEITKGELVISATCTSSVQGNTCDGFEKIVPTKLTEAHNVLVKNGISIEPSEIHTYTLTVEFIETGSNQNYNQDKYFNGTLNVEEGAETHPLYDVVESLAESGRYFSAYSGDSNDTYGENGTKTIYYPKPTNTTVSPLRRKINVKFAGYCWQILRTTDTGGVKLIYNGDPDSTTGDCKTINTTDTHKGVIMAANSVLSIADMSGAYQYSDSYTYDLTAGTFTLTNPSVDNYANNKNLIGKYTCMTNSTTTTCSTLYYLNTPSMLENNPYIVPYTIGDTQNAQLGTTAFNNDNESPAYVGYKFGLAYDSGGITAPTSGSIMGHDVYWNGTNYELRESDNSVSTGTTYDDNHHYTCNSTSATCTDGKVRYYYYGNTYIELLNGDDIDTALTRMLEANTYDSAIKSYIENWFRNKMIAYMDYLDENAVFCNDRTITQIGGWSNTGGIGTGESNYLKFTNYDTTTSLNCTKNTDKFSVGNFNAELNYPVGLATAPEMNIINRPSFITTGQKSFWLMSPTHHPASMRYVHTSGAIDKNGAYFNYGVRPVITLAPTSIPVTGTGAYDNPYIIGE